MERAVTHDLRIAPRSERRPTRRAEQRVANRLQPVRHRQDATDGLQDRRQCGRSLRRSLLRPPACCHLRSHGALGFVCLGRAVTLTHNRANDIPHGIGMPGRNLQQDACRTFWRPTTLLPIPQRAHADAEQSGELPLRESIARPNALDMREDSLPLSHPHAIIPPVPFRNTQAGSS